MIGARWIGALLTLGVLLGSSLAVAGPTYLGDYPTGATVHCYWNTNAQDGASITRSTDGTLKVYKNDSLTERTSLSGIVQTEDMGADAHAGVHKIAVDTSDNTDAGFYAAGNEYHLVITGATIDTKTVNAALCSFSLERSGGTLALIKGTGVKVSSGTGAGQLNLSSGRIVADYSSLTVDVYKKGTTSLIYNIFIADQRTGAGLTGITSGSAGLTWYYCRADQGNNPCSQVTLAAGTRGSWVSGGIIEKDATNAPGEYEISIPNASLATGAGLVTHYLKGAANMSPVVLKIGLVDNDALDVVGATDDIIALLGTPVTASIAEDIAGIFDQAMASHLTAGSTGEKLNAAASAGDPWTTTLPGAYGAGTAGKIIGDNLNATITSRASQTSLDAVDDFVDTEVAAIKAKTDTLPTFPTNFASLLVNSSGVGTAGGTFRRNIASGAGNPGYPVYMVDSSGNPVTGATVTVRVSKDGAASSVIGGSVAQIDATNFAGWYWVTFTAGDVDCGTCTYRATASGAVPRPFFFSTAP